MLTFFSTCVVACVQFTPNAVPGNNAVLTITKPAFRLGREIQRHEHR